MARDMAGIAAGRQRSSDGALACYNETMVSKALKKILDRIETWPERAQDEAAATLEAIEQDLLTPQSMSDEDKQALERSAEDVRQGRFAADQAIAELFGRYRRT